MSGNPTKDDLSTHAHTARLAAENDAFCQRIAKPSEPPTSNERVYPESESRAVIACGLREWAERLPADMFGRSRVRELMLDAALVLAADAERIADETAVVGVLPTVTRPPLQFEWEVNPLHVCPHGGERPSCPQCAADKSSAPPAGPPNELVSKGGTVKPGDSEP